MRSNPRLRWAAVPLAAAVMIALAGCTPEQLRGWLPTEPGTTDHVDGVIGLWNTSWIVLLVVGVITWGLLIWAMIVYRRRKGQTGLPLQMRYNMPIEIFYTIVPLILVIGLFAATVREQVVIEARDENPDLVVEVYGKQWSWDINYVSDDVYDSGIQGQPSGPGAGDAVDQDALPTLYLPVGQTVEFRLETRDVIHSFWVVEFLYKKDMIPGKTNYWTVTPLKEGDFTGKCAELCGQYHSMMLFNVKVVSQAEYDEHIESLRAKGQDGQLGEEYNRDPNAEINSAEH